MEVEDFDSENEFKSTKETSNEEERVASPNTDDELRGVPEFPDKEPEPNEIEQQESNNVHSSQDDTEVQVIEDLSNEELAVEDVPADSPRDQTKQEQPTDVQSQALSEQEHNAATQIQKVYRGHAQRAKYKQEKENAKAEKQKIVEEPPVVIHQPETAQSPVEESTPEQSPETSNAQNEDAAIKIQKVYKGYSQRKRYNTEKAEKKNKLDEQTKPEEVKEVQEVVEDITEEDLEEEDLSKSEPVERPKSTISVEKQRTPRVATPPVEQVKEEIVEEAKPQTPKETEQTVVEDAVEETLKPESPKRPKSTPRREKTPRTPRIEPSQEIPTETVVEEVIVKPESPRRPKSTPRREKTPRTPRIEPPQENPTESIVEEVVMEETVKPESPRRPKSTPRREKTPRSEVPPRVESEPSKRPQISPRESVEDIVMEEEAPKPEAPKRPKSARRIEKTEEIVKADNTQAEATAVTKPPPRNPPPKSRLRQPQPINHNHIGNGVVQEAKEKVKKHPKATENVSPELEEQMQRILEEPIPSHHNHKLQPIPRNEKHHSNNTHNSSTPNGAPKLAPLEPADRKPPSKNSNKSPNRENGIKENGHATKKVSEAHSPPHFHGNNEKDNDPPSPLNATSEEEFQDAVSQQTQDQIKRLHAELRKKNARINELKEKNKMLLQAQNAPKPDIPDILLLKDEIKTLRKRSIEDEKLLRQKQEMIDNLKLHFAKLNKLLQTRRAEAEGGKHSTAAWRAELVKRNQDLQAKQQLIESLERKIENLRQAKEKEAYQFAHKTRKLENEIAFLRGELHSVHKFVKEKGLASPDSLGSLGSASSTGSSGSKKLLEPLPKPAKVPDEPLATNPALRAPRVERVPFDMRRGDHSHVDNPALNAPHVKRPPFRPLAPVAK